MQPPNKKERRRARLKLEDEQQKARALSTPRLPNDNISFRGVGLLRLRLAIFPSFSPPRCWEIHDVPTDSDATELQLHLSQGTTPGPHVLGHTRLNTPHATLAALLDRLSTITLPLHLPPITFVSADGTNYELTIEGGPFPTKIHIAWSQHHLPSTWQTLESFTTDAEKLFTQP